MRQHQVRRCQPVDLLCPVLQLRAAVATGDFAQQQLEVAIVRTVIAAEQAPGLVIDCAHGGGRDVAATARIVARCGRGEPERPVFVAAQGGVV
jgi:hypothetical protein